jgi:hypothetical protein
MRVLCVAVWRTRPSVLFVLEARFSLPIDKGRLVLMRVPFAVFPDSPHRIFPPPLPSSPFPLPLPGILRIILCDNADNATRRDTKILAARKFGRPGVRGPLKNRPVSSIKRYFAGGGRFFRAGPFRP